MQSLGSVTFTFNPDRQSIPQIRKTVASVPTYEGSAIFQWSGTWEGSQILLEWDFLPSAQYDSLYALYLGTDELVYDTDTGGDKYTVIPVDMTGTYFETALEDLSYRKDVKLTLEIRDYTYDPPVES